MDDSSPPPPAPAGPPPLPPPLRPPRKTNGWMILSIVLICVLLVFIAGSALRAFQGLLGGGPHRAAAPRLEEVTVEQNHSDHKILVMPIEGMIMSGGYGLQDQVRFIQEQFKQAERDDRVKAVLLKVNSPGGEVLASDNISAAIRKFQKESGKPVVASMGSLAASGGYYVAAPCRWIVAHELTITGSIGVIMSAYNYRGLLDKVGLRPEVFKSGQYKDMLSGSKKETDITPEERAMVQKLVDQTFERFKSVVAEGRKQANEQNKGGNQDPGRALSGDWKEFADGRVLSGKEAFDLGFVDELGDLETAVERARNLANIDDANLVQYQPVLDLASLFRLFGKSEPTTLKVDLGMDLPRLEAGKLYFLSPTFVH